MGYSYFNFVSTFLNRMKSSQKVERMFEIGAATAGLAVMISIHYRKLKSKKEEARLAAEEHRKKAEEFERNLFKNRPCQYE
ncbi:hypothetical protein FRX31_015464 [Thalictrum thalictroides]|uniref:Uncharacterized protein n=1 Tax=Thalictrum thalictroides TaxID=46969 RepID=A0A7J6WD98_THATH|nr:hypothetical protein FRX31_015464 [Thalictrum thalictroides]